MRVLIFDDDELRHSEYDRIGSTDGKDVAFKIVPLEDDKLPKFVIMQSVNPWDICNEEHYRKMWCRSRLASFLHDEQLWSSVICAK